MLTGIRWRFSGPAAGTMKIERLEVDKLEPVGFFPLLQSSFDYLPDTIDLSTDNEARDYWLNCFRCKKFCISSFLVRLRHSPAAVVKEEIVSCKLILSQCSN